MDGTAACNAGSSKFGDVHEVAMLPGAISPVVGENGNSVMVARDSETDGDSITMDRSHTADKTFSGVAGMTTGDGSGIGMALGGYDSLVFECFDQCPKDIGKLFNCGGICVAGSVGG